MSSEQIDKVRPFLLPSSILPYLRPDPTDFNIHVSILAFRWVTDDIGCCGTGRGHRIAQWQLRFTHGHRFSAARLAPRAGYSEPLESEFSPDSITVSIPPCMYVCSSL